MLTSHPAHTPESPVALLGDQEDGPHTPTAPVEPYAGGHVLAVGTPGPRLDRLTRTLRATGHDVSHAAPGGIGQQVSQAPPDAIVALDEPAGHPAADDRDHDPRAGLDVIREIRTAPAGRALPLLMVTGAPGSAGVVDMLRNGADDCIPEASDPVELSARIEAKLRRLPVPVENLLLDPRTGLYSHPHFVDELDRELQRPEASRSGGVLAVVGVAEMHALEARLGPRVRREVAERLAGVVNAISPARTESRAWGGVSPARTESRAWGGVSPARTESRAWGGVSPARTESRAWGRLGSFCDRFGWDEDGHLLMLLPGVDGETARRSLEKFAATVAGTRFVVADENVRLTPAIGWLPLAECPDGGEGLRRAGGAVTEALRHRDLRPVRYARWMRGTPHHRRRRPLGSLVRPALSALSPVLVLLLGVAVPFVLYRQSYALGWDLGSAMYWVVVAGLVLSALLIVLECLFSLDATARPASPGAPYPPASAVIAAYLPNEAATIVETVESFLRLDYPGELEIVLAYNTPHPLPVEDTLRAIARRDPRLVLLPVVGSTSKAQNVNAAVTRVRGEFVGIFDADHHPAPAAFRDAWHWLSNGYDVVQGHCVIRNGDSSRVAKLVAVEFEAIYAVSHPGRTRLYGFGVFGGSNGFWRTDLLARTRMHGSMLTEDIDSTLRALGEGARFAVDRTLLSRELAPTTLTALWNQRSRWAQGWLQVSLKHLWSGLRSPAFTARQKLGLLVLLGWREVQPWLTLQILPVLAYSAWRAGGLQHLDWAVPVCVLAMLFTVAAGPVQALFAWRLAVPELRGRGPWFWSYLLVSTVFYSHFKNMVARQAHLKEALGDRQWRVTPRAAVKAVARR
ncbi:glycosyltransferase [Streptomyces pinistramenti]|uniref:glycosyltransferase n=1 Tax=Streptomyces pinistramenti TaxID=2884812 RepID=UPI001D074DD9|nr:glycosyltransferase [Streptomyces pinistramenti]MCB5912103.1 glycosyltransferase [Streptomyces pinistramenti]